MAASNKALIAVLAQIKAKVKRARNKEEILASIDDAIAYGRELKFKYEISTEIAICSAVVAAITVCTFVYLNAWNFENGVLSAVGVLAFTLIAGAIVYYSRKSDISGVSEKIAYKAALLDNGLTKVDNKTIGKNLLKEFKEFKRGNHLQEFERLLEGKHSGHEFEYTYTYFDFHYVQRTTRTEVTTDSKGRTSTRTVTEYHHYYRYGVILPFSNVDSIAICENEPSGLKRSDYRPSSNLFNKKFDVFGSDEMKISKFLKPAVVLKLEDMTNDFSALNLEFNKEGFLCVSFSNDDIVEVNAIESLTNPIAFKNEIAGIRKLDKLALVFEYIDFIKKHSDSNFN